MSETIYAIITCKDLLTGRMFRSSYIQNMRNVTEDIEMYNRYGNCTKEFNYEII
jgi:hypothetical protein